MHNTGRIIKTTLGAVALATVLTLGLTACNPLKGQADIKASGTPINGSARGPKVTCSSTSKKNLRTWNGALGGRPQVTVKFEMDKVTGRDKVSIDWLKPGGAEGYFTGDDKDLVTVDSSKVAHFSGRVGGDTKYVTLTAALACP